MDGRGDPEPMDEGDGPRPLHEWDRDELALAMRTAIIGEDGEYYVEMEPNWSAADELIARRDSVGSERVVARRATEGVERERPGVDTVGVRTESVIIGTDGRTVVNPTTVDPFYAVTRYNTFTGSTGQTFGTTCTGAWIGPWTFVTAAHCIRRTVGGALPTRIRFEPARNDLALPYGTYDCRMYDSDPNNNITMALPAGWTGAGEAEAQFDYAVFDMWPCQTVPLATTLDGYVVDSGSATYSMHGYPQETATRCPGSPYTDVFQCGMSGSGYINDFRIESQYIDSSGGQSGGPWWRNVSGSNYLAAVHRGSRSFFDFGMCGFSNCVRNYGRRIDSTVESFIQVNSYDY